MRTGFTTINPLQTAHRIFQRQIQETPTRLAEPIRDELFLDGKLIVEKKLNEQELFQQYGIKPRHAIEAEKALADYRKNLLK